MIRHRPLWKSFASRGLMFCAALAVVTTFSRCAFAQGDSIVKIFSSYQGFSSLYPWEKEKFSQRTAFGTLIDDKYIVTTADTVADYTYIELKKTTDDKKFQASVTASPTPAGFPGGRKRMAWSTLLSAKRISRK